jgi:hypothetical protein
VTEMQEDLIKMRQAASQVILYASAAADIELQSFFIAGQASQNSWR